MVGALSISIIIVTLTLISSSSGICSHSFSHSHSRISGDLRTSGDLTSTSKILAKFKREYKSRNELNKLQKETLKMGALAIPPLIEVMKSNKYPDPNRWMATFLLGRIAGHKSSPFIAKFLFHPNWVLRMASLKTLLALKETRYSADYASKLKDDSLLVRTQALENIRFLKINSYAPAVMEMLFQKQNYQLVNGKLIKTPLIRNVIRAVGDLGHKDAKSHLLSMIQKEDNMDVFEDIDYSLRKITGQTPTSTNKAARKTYWAKLIDSSST